MSEFWKGVLEVGLDTVKVVVVVMVVLGALHLLTGCAVNGAIYKDSRRSILPLSFEGSPTFCSEGVYTPVVDVKPIGWGPDECVRRGTVPLPD